MYFIIVQVAVLATLALLLAAIGGSDMSLLYIYMYSATNVVSELFYFLFSSVLCIESSMYWFYFTVAIQNRHFIWRQLDFGDVL